MGKYNSRLVDAGWSSLVARRAHNPKVVGSNPAPATNIKETPFMGFFIILSKLDDVETSECVLVLS